MIWRCASGAAGSSDVSGAAQAYDQCLAYKVLGYLHQSDSYEDWRYGNPETTTGGNALKFYSSVRLDIRRVGAIKRADEVIGNETRVKVVKNKVAPPLKQVSI